MKLQIKQNKELINMMEVYLGNVDVRSLKVFKNETIDEEE